MIESRSFSFSSPPAEDGQINRPLRSDLDAFAAEPLDLFRSSPGRRERNPSPGVDHSMPGQAITIRRRMQNPGDLPGLARIAREGRDLPVRSDFPAGDRANEGPNPAGEGKDPAFTQNFSRNGPLTTFPVIIKPESLLPRA